MNLKLQEGQAASAFGAATQDSKTLSLHELKGKSVVLYFYPRDDTPGRTQEACGFRDSWKETQKTGAMMLGVTWQQDFKPTP